MGYIYRHEQLQQTDANNSLPLVIPITGCISIYAIRIQYFIFKTTCLHLERIFDETVLWVLLFVFDVPDLDDCTFDIELRVNFIDFVGQWL